MHILVGALIGAVVGVVATVVVAKATGKPITWKGIAAGAVGGAVGGAVTAATFGAGGAAAATATRALTAYVAGGGAGGAADKAAENLLNGKPIHQGVAESAAFGAATGAVLYGAGKALAPVVRPFFRKIASRLPARAPRVPVETGPPASDPRAALAKYARDQLTKGGQNADDVLARGAQENEAHVLRMVDTIDQNRAAVRAAGADPDTTINAILYSDLGKNPEYLEAHAKKLFPELYANEKTRGLAKFKAFLLHEEPGIDLVRQKGAELGVPQAEIDRIVKGIVGHNGPGVEGTFWQKNFDALVASEKPTPLSPLVGKSYPLPEGPEAGLHTVLDRLDQGGLVMTAEGFAGGPKKISADLLKQGQTLEAAMVEAIGNNPRMTKLQVDRLRELFPKVFDLDFVQAGERNLDQTMRLLDNVKFSDGGKVATITTPEGAFVATDFDGFWRGLSKSVGVESGLPLDVVTRTTDTTARGVTSTVGGSAAAGAGAPIGQGNQGSSGPEAKTRGLVGAVDEAN